MARNNHAKPADPLADLERMRQLAEREAWDRHRKQIRNWRMSVVRAQGRAQVKADEKLAARILVWFQMLLGLCVLAGMIVCEALCGP
jgi:hypothetical protein